MSTITLDLPLPSLSEGCFDSVLAVTDEQLFQKTGVRIAFTQREGGVSTGAYESLNIGMHVGDDQHLVQKNRQRILTAFSAQVDRCIVPQQLHGNTVVSMSENASFEEAQAMAEQGADAVAIQATGISALLAYADCVPVIIVAPQGAFAVVHAGWRGVVNGVVVAAFAQLAHLVGKEFDETFTRQCNVYFGPYIHAECFEVRSEVHQVFVEKFGPSCAVGTTHIDMGKALRIALLGIGADDQRIVDAAQCSVCNNDRYFSYRAQNGICGRHGAFAVRHRN